MKYIVRVGYDTDWAYDQWNKDISVRKTIEGISKELNVGELLSSQWTYTVFAMEAGSPAECEQRILDAWNLRGFEPNSQPTFMIVEDDGSEIAEVMKTMYKVYFGWEPYLKLCTDMVRSLPFLKATDNCAIYRNMNYLVAMDEGCGFQTMVNSFADFLHKLGAFETFSGTTYRYTIGPEDTLGVTEAGDVIDLLWDEEYQNTVIGIDISYYLDSERKEEFRTFLKQLLRLKDKCVFLLRVPSLSQRVLKDLCESINDILELKVLEIGPYNDFTFMDVADDVLTQHGYNASIQVLDLVVQRIHKEKMDGRFYSYKTINKIANEIIWAKAQNEANKKYRGEETSITEIAREDMNELELTIADDRDGYDELSELIGMEAITERIKEIVAQLTLAVNNPNMERPCLHMRFVGAPGTGKTTVARIVGKIFKQKGILRKGDFFEYEARSLCGEYVGQTAPKTHAVCRDAYGSVLFIDEAYGLYSKDNDRDYGKEALTALIAEMENHRDDMVIIMAGYTDDMEQLMEGNSGLRSRMPFVLEFKSYTREQLVAIFMRMAQKHFVCEEGLEETVRTFFNKLADSYLNSKEFSNARFVRNLYERTWAKASLRTASAFQTEIILTGEDFTNASMEKEFSEKLMLEKKIGFQ